MHNISVITTTVLPKRAESNQSGPNGATATAALVTDEGGMEEAKTTKLMMIVIDFDSKCLL